MQIKVHATSADIKLLVCLIKFMALCSNNLLPFGYLGDYSGFLLKRKKISWIFFPFLMFFHSLMARRVTEIVFWLCLLWGKYCLFHEVQFNFAVLCWEWLDVENWNKTNHHQTRRKLLIFIFIFFVNSKHFLKTILRC